MPYAIDAKGPKLSFRNSRAINSLSRMEIQNDRMAQTWSPNLPDIKFAKQEAGKWLGSKRVEGDSNWGGDQILATSGRLRARRYFKLPSKCQRCPAKASDRHHRDGNPLNNDPSNIEFLCRSCHMREDGRSKAAIEVASKHTGKKRGPLIKPYKYGKCSVCGKFNKEGMGSAHGERDHG